MLRKLLRKVVSPPSISTQIPQQAKNYTDVVGQGITIPQQIEEVSINTDTQPMQHEIDMSQTDTQPMQFDTSNDIDLTFESVDVYQDVQLSMLGQKVQEVLNRWGNIGKQSLDAKIILEDSQSTPNESHFYFEYANDIQPADFRNFALKNNAKMVANIEACLICDGVKILQAGTGAKNMAKIIVLNGRV